MESIQKTTRQLAGASRLFGLAFFSRESIASECSINGFDPASKNRLPPPNPSKSSVRTGPNLGSLTTPVPRTENQNRYTQWLDRT